MPKNASKFNAKKFNKKTVGSQNYSKFLNFGGAGVSMPLGNSGENLLFFYLIQII
jgi:hypothetical protein